MVRFTSHWFRIGSLAGVIALCAGSARPVYALHVAAKADLPTVHVGQRVMVTITATRSDSLGDPQFAGAGVQTGPAWELGGQVTQSPTLVGSQVVKTWQFELIALSPESTRVVPVVYLGGDPTLGHRADSILGAPVYLAILPVPPRPLWPWIVGAVVAIAIPALSIWVSIRKRRKNQPFERPLGTPLEEALEMLETIRVNRREDRAQRYLADLERLLDGYVSRRLDQSLSGKTEAEIVASVAARVPDREVIDSLQSILQRCAASRFGGVRMGIEALVELDDQARRTLEQMDARWV